MFIISPISNSRGVTFPQGFKASSTNAGIRQKEKDDLVLIVSDSLCNSAIVRTKNKVKAAPILVSDEHLEQSGAKSRAIIINTGYANACTGEPGMQTAYKSTEAVATGLDIPKEQVLVASTGVIGVPYDAEPIERSTPYLMETLTEGESIDEKVATTILTTDTVAKTASITLQVAGDKEIKLGGMAKGSGMIAPAMATTITIITTDAKIEANILQELLEEAVAKTFNKVSVDGAMSTNDTVILLASGKSAGVDKIAFGEALNRLCADLAYQIIADGEGATQVVVMKVTGAKNREEAAKAARFIGQDLLVRTAFAGRDPNWGRVVAAAGASDVDLDPDRLSVIFAGTKVCENSLPIPFDKTQVAEAMSQKEVVVEVDLGVGESSDWVYVNDLTHDYITINADYTT